MFDEMQQIFHQLKHDTRVIPEEIIFCNVISFYGRARLLEHALQVFDEMSSFNVQRTVKSLNTLLNAMLTCGKLDRMKELFQIMEKYVSPYHQLGTVCNSCCNPLLCSHCNPLLCWLCCMSVLKSAILKFWKVIIWVWYISTTQPAGGQ